MKKTSIMLMGMGALVLTSVAVPKETWNYLGRTVESGLSRFTSISGLESDVTDEAVMMGGKSPVQTEVASRTPNEPNQVVAETLYDQYKATDALQVQDNGGVSYQAGLPKPTVGGSGKVKISGRRASNLRSEGIDRLIDIALDLDICSESFGMTGDHPFSYIINYQPSESQLINEIAVNGGYGMTCNGEFLIVGKEAGLNLGTGKYRVDVKRIDQDGRALHYDTLDRALESYNGGKTIVRGGPAKEKKRENSGDATHWRGEH